MTDQEITDLLLTSEAYLLEIVEEMLIQEKKGCLDCGEKSKAERIIMNYSYLLDAISIPLLPTDPNIIPIISFTQPANMNIGDTDQTLTFSTTNPNVTALVSSLNPNIATIINGKLHAVANGTATIRVTSPASNGYDSVYLDRTVTVSVALNKVDWTYVDTVPADLTAMTFLFTANLANNANIAANFTSAGNGKYLIVKQHVTMPAKTNWFNTAFNYGTFPDSVFLAPQVLGGFRYYVSRIPVILDSTTSIITLS